MKTTATIIMIALLILSCKNDRLTKNSETTETSKPSLVGVWQMVGFYNYHDNKIVDSFMNSDTFKQIKIYTPTKVMWSRLNGQDSTDWFGYGDYKITDSTLYEIIYYGSNSMNKAIEINNEFNFELILNEDTYSQIVLDEHGDKILSENYMRIE